MLPFLRTVGIPWFEHYGSGHPDESLITALEHFVETEGGRK
jgi:hypothetical protein